MDKMMDDDGLETISILSSTTVETIGFSQIKLR